jgi:P27 family predicted phage terminase small subunit
MPAHSKPLERIQATARNSTHKSDGRELVKAEYTIVKRVDAPKMPAGLKRRGKQEWTQIWAVGPWLNPEQDYPWVEMIARAYDDIDTFRRQVQKDGLIVKGYAGQTVAHPLIAEIRKCEDTIRRCLSVLGYSPTDRARLGLAEVKRQSALQDFLDKSDANKR